MDRPASTRSALRAVMAALTCLVAMLLHAPPAGAGESDPLVMTFEPQFDLDWSQDDSWTPVAVRLKNDGRTELPVRIHVGFLDRNSNFSGSPSAFAELSLPAGADKRLVLHLPPGMLSRFPQSVAVAWSSGFEPGGPAPIIPVYNSGRAQGVRVLVVSRPPALAAAKIALADLDDFDLAGTREKIDFRFSQPEGLPERHVGYEPFEIIVLHEIDPASVTEAARRAICDWVAAGGTMVLSPGDDALLFADPVLGSVHPFKAVDTLPARPVSEFGPASSGSLPVQTVHVFTGGVEIMRAIEGQPLVSVARSGLGATVAMGTSLSAFRYILQKTPTGKRSLGFMPVLAAHSPARTFGTGRIHSPTVFVPGFEAAAMTPVLAEWPSMRSFPLFDHVLRFDRIEDDSMVPDFAASLAAGAAGTPGLGWIALVLFLFIALVGPVNYVVLRRRRTPALTSITVPALSLAFVAIIIGTGLLTKGGSRGNRVIVLETTPGSPLAVNTSFIYFRSGSGGSYSISSLDGASLVCQPRTPFALDQSGVENTIVKLDRWESVFMSGESVSAMGGAVEAAEIGGGLALTNGLPFPVKGGMMMREDSRAEIAASGARIAARGITARAGETVTVADGAGLFAPMTEEETMLAALVDHVSMGGRTLTFGCWIDAERPGILVDGRPLRFVHDRIALVMRIR